MASKEFVLFLDCDGVLADFDKRAKMLFGMSPFEFEEKYGTGKFWQKIQQDKEFFFNLEMMEDAHDLYEGVKHLNPMILTGVPSHKEAISQKVRWIRKMMGRNIAIICCPSKEKSFYCTSGDILVDDTLKHSQKWIDAGGIFVHHTSAKNSLDKLREMEVI